eukprot:TRINITY_DN13667_c0_g2_i3.p1 TRINITY_DN13667_c0_g2~~TRINITY_DN13667_c0_g2_i3.p1  ORF type:complete len:177 (-),score=26.19 TRINITY_DN13667_c0_g2_i3:10-540(-)
MPNTFFARAMYAWNKRAQLVFGIFWYSLTLGCLAPVVAASADSSVGDSQKASFNYQAASADINSDGYPDLLLTLTGPPERVEGSPSGSSWPTELVIISNPAGQYSVSSDPVVRVLASASVWRPAKYSFAFGDTDGDGRDEMLVRSIEPNGLNLLLSEIGRAVQQECRDRSRMPSSA